MFNTLNMAPKEKFDSIGKCIYCHSASDALSEEHIIPYGLNGNFVLSEASCKVCAAITSKFEEKVLKGFMEKGRQALGLKTRRRSKRKPTPNKLKFKLPDGVWSEEIEFDENITFMHLPCFVTPIGLGGKSNNDNPASIDIFAVDTMHLGGMVGVLEQKNIPAVQQIEKLDIWSFVRMLAKIGHSYHVAMRGEFPLSESPVVNIALGKSDHAKHWIGCLEEHPLTKVGSKALHLMDITDLQGANGSIATVVRIKFFDPVKGPTYAVVTRVILGNKK
ncbi:hypothetical protein H1D31_01990 [Alishewanella sp. BS5-314]|uniref:HNH endonuclease n=2 Tax=Gammaproteobacteria TaxID=1236 RepID=UPI0021BB467F|nr:HNH endonuclease [Alishewanella sp. BS5-314]MCT8124808.1 hypothetical protein [Alishewanella sp. BS5-314]